MITLYLHDWPGTAGFAAVQLLGFTVLRCNGWPDSLSNKVSAFVEQSENIYLNEIIIS